MGRDKALLEVGGRPLVLRAVEALDAAGAGEVLVVGGDAPALADLGLAVVADEHPGAGPLGALVTALHAARHEVVVLLPCDLLAPSPGAVRAVAAALDGAPEALWAAPESGGWRQLLHAAYRRTGAHHWAAAFTAGERSLQRPADQVPGVLVAGLDPAALADADTPEDLPPTDG